MPSNFPNIVEQGARAPQYDSTQPHPVVSITVSAHNWHYQRPQLQTEEVDKEQGYLSLFNISSSVIRQSLTASQETWITFSEDKS